MEFTEQDRNALYDTWMSQKAKMHITQMDMAKRLGLNLHEFSGLLRGNSPLTLGFVHGSENWTWNGAQQSRVRAVEMSYLRGASGVSRW